MSQTIDQSLLELTLEDTEADLIRILASLQPEQRLDYILEHGKSRGASLMVQPLLVIHWCEEAVKAAQANGPHRDRLDQPDPRTIESIESFLVAAGGTHHAFGVIQFSDPTVMARALRDLLLQHPWGKFNDPSHATAAGGSIVHSCTQVDATEGKLGFVPNYAFEC